MKANDSFHKRFAGGIAAICPKADHPIPSRRAKNKAGISESMDPNPLNRAEWANAGNAIKLLWISLVLMFTAAQLFLAAHAIIPSSIASHHLSRRWNRVRPLLYASGFGCLVAVGIAMFFLIGPLGVGDLAHRIFPSLYR